MASTCSSVTAALAARPKALQEVGENRVGVQRDVPEHIVEDVRLREVVEVAARAYGDRGGKAPLGQAPEELPGRQEARNGNGGPPGASPEAGIHIGEVGHAVTMQADAVGPFEEEAAPGVLQHRHTALV